MAGIYGMGTLDTKKLLHRLLSNVSGSGHLRMCLGLGALGSPQPCSTFWFSSSSPLPVQEGCRSSMHLDCFQTSHRGAEVGFSSVALFSDSEADLSPEPPGLAAVVLGPDVSMATHDPGSK